RAVEACPPQLAHRCRGLSDPRENEAFGSGKILRSGGHQVAGTEVAQDVLHALEVARSVVDDDSGPCAHWGSSAFGVSGGGDMPFRREMKNGNISSSEKWRPMSLT